MTNEKKCYYHKDKTTLISCASCGKPICPICARPAAIGYQCPDCAGEEPEKEKNPIKINDWIHTLIQSALAGILLGFLWNFTKQYGMFLNWGSAYLVGFAIAKSITKYEGFQDKKRFITAVTIIALISMVYNPISIGLTASQFGFLPTLTVFTILAFSNIINIIAITIGVWAAIRHLKF